MKTELLELADEIPALIGQVVCNGMFGGPVTEHIQQRLRALASHWDDLATGEREAFEKAFATGHTEIDRRNFHYYKNYTEPRIQALWEGWQERALQDAIVLPRAEQLRALAAKQSGEATASLDALLKAHCDGVQVCCGNTRGGGYDECGNGEPPECCGSPDDLSHEIRKAMQAASDSHQNCAARIHRNMVQDNNEIAAMADLAHEYEELREDAKRFRFCRDRASKCGGIWIVEFLDTSTLPSSFTEACDAARKEWEA